MGYSEALEAAGAKVLSYDISGDYQGTWLAVCEHKGQRIAVEGYYGSCSGCDAFDAEFSDWGPSRYQYDTEEEYKNAKEQFDNTEQDRLATFGQSYLHTSLTGEELKEKYQDLIAKKILEDGYFFDQDTIELYEKAIPYFS
jgi:hypothetical protein